MKGLLRKPEVLIAIILSAIFIMWSSSKCREATVHPSPEEVSAADSIKQIEQPIASADGTKDGLLSDALREKIAERATADSLAAVAMRDSLAGTPAAVNTPGKTAEPIYNYLWVTIDKLKIRDQPGLKSNVLGELKLFDKVYYLEERTDTTYQVNLGYEVADEPYVKVKTQRGTVGWVYGAGVDYHKQKRQGVME